MKDEKRRRVMMWIAAVVAVLLLIGVVSWIWERSYYGDQPFTFSQLILLLLIIPVGVLLFAMFVNPDKKQRGTSGGGPSNPVVASFPDAFTTVVVPWQGRPVTVVRVPSVPLDQMKGTNNDFEPKELVINVEVVDANKEHTIMTDFDPTLEIEFNFPKTLIDNARKLAAQTDIQINSANDFTSVIKIGFWDGVRWVQFTRENHAYRIQGNESTGYVGKVNLTKWGAPPIAWNPPK